MSEPRQPASGVTGNRTGVTGIVLLLIGLAALGVAAAGFLSFRLIGDQPPQGGAGPAQPVAGERPRPEPAERPRPEPAAQPAQPKTASGAELYVAHCAACHGDKGDGLGPAARFLYPKPRNFREAKFRVVSTANSRPSDEDLLNVITRGMPGSAMIPFGHLSEQDRRALVAHVRLLTRTGLVEVMTKRLADEGEDVDPAELARRADRLLQPGDPYLPPAGFPPADPGSVARGEKLYQATCASCHGKTGKGDGGQDQRDEDGTPTRPRDLTRGIYKGGRDPQQLYARIMLGMPGTPMPSHTIALKPADAGDVINFILSLSDQSAQTKVEHKRTMLVAKRAVNPLPDEIPDAVWSAAPTATIVTSPLWWREYPDPELAVTAVHDGRTLAVRLTWRDASRNDAVVRPEDFEDMAAVQLYKGGPEPFLGMGSEAGHIDLWQWRAGRTRDAALANSKLDDYPLDAPQYPGLLRDKSKLPPDQYTARAAGNQLASADAHGGASSLTAKGVGSTTMRPRASQTVTAKAAWKDGRWTVVLRRPLAVGAGDGIGLAPGDRCSVAFALWDGAARDRNGQKLVTIWHDLTVE